MGPIILTKSILCKEEIKKVSNILIEDDFKYQFSNSEMHIIGVAHVKGKFSFETHEELFSDEVEVDVVLSLEKINCYEDIKLELRDYDIKVEGPQLMLSLRYQLFANGEVCQSFNGSKDEMVSSTLVDALLCKELETVREENSLYREEEIMDLLKILENENVEIISSLDTLHPLNSMSDKDFETLEKNILQRKTSTSSIKPTPKITSQPKENIFDEETYVVSYIYYILKPGETFADVSKKFSCSEEEIKKVNSNKKEVAGNLILVAKK